MTANSENFSPPDPDIEGCARFASAFREKYPDCGDPSHSLVVMLMIRVAHLRHIMKQHGIEIDETTMPSWDEDPDGTITEERTVRGLREALQSLRAMCRWHGRWVSKMNEDTPASAKWRKLCMEHFSKQYEYLEAALVGVVGDDSSG